MRTEHYSVSMVSEKNINHCFMENLSLRNAELSGGRGYGTKKEKKLSHKTLSPYMVMIF